MRLIDADEFKKRIDHYPAEIRDIAKESADKISKALEKVRAKGMQKQNIKGDDKT